MTATIQFDALPYQGKIITSTKPMIFAGCGVGSGKSHLGSLWTLQRCIEAPEGVKGIVAANTYPQLYDSTLDRMLQNWQEWGVTFRPQTLPRSYGALNVEVCTGGKWTTLRCRSLSHYEAIAGMEVGFYWEDEAWGAPEEGFAELEKRNRDTRMPQRALVTSWLDEMDSWMYRRFVENFGTITAQGKGDNWWWEESDRKLAVYATTHCNLKHLPSDYVEKLTDSLTPRMFDRQVLSKWMAEGSGIYYGFSREKSVTEAADYEAGLGQVWLTCDFNIGEGKPMSWALCQERKGRLYQWAEIILDTADTNQAAEEVAARLADVGLSPAEVHVCGDASGRARDTRSKRTDYEILREHGFVHQDVPTKNPPIRERHNAVNVAFCSKSGERRYLIHPRCTGTIHGWLTTRIKKGANYIEQETTHQHITTALGYLICRKFPMRPRVWSGKIW